MNKRGDLQSILIITIILFGMATFAILSFGVFGEVFTELSGLEEMPQESVDAMDTINEKGGGWIDYFIFFTFIAFMLGLIISSIFIPSHPAMMMIVLIGFVVVIFLASIFGDIFQDIFYDELLVNYTSEFPLTSLLFDNLAVILFIVGIITFLILFGKSRGGDMLWKN